MHSFFLKQGRLFSQNPFFPPLLSKRKLVPKTNFLVIKVEEEEEAEGGSAIGQGTTILESTLPFLFFSGGRGLPKGTTFCTGFFVPSSFQIRPLAIRWRKVLMARWVRDSKSIRVAKTLGDIFLFFFDFFSPELEGKTATRDAHIQVMCGKLCYPTVVCI